MMPEPTPLPTMPASEEKHERADTQEAQGIGHIAQYDFKQLEEILDNEVRDALVLRLPAVHKAAERLFEEDEHYRYQYAADRKQLCIQPELHKHIDQQQYQRGIERDAAQAVVAEERRADIPFFDA
mgnify:CR=1 FL=1